MKRIMRWLVPKEEKFFQMLAEQSENALEGANELKSLVDDYSNLERGDRKASVYSIKKLENKGDEISRRVFERLNKNFRTPFDKEDIHEMAVILDDIMDLIDAVASRFVILSIERIEQPIIKLLDKAYSGVSEVNKSISDLRKLKHMEEHCNRIYAIEKEADDIYHEALSELFHFYKNSIDIVKYKEIYELLESIADKCKDIADVIKGIEIKHS